jgi:hypothetical protein
MSLLYHPPVVSTPPVGGLAAPSITLVEIFVLMGMVFLLTRRRFVPDMAMNPS